MANYTMKYILILLVVLLLSGVASADYPLSPFGNWTSYDENDPNDRYYWDTSIYPDQIYWYAHSWYWHLEPAGAYAKLTQTITVPEEKYYLITGMQTSNEPFWFTDIIVNNTIVCRINNWIWQSRYYCGYTFPAGTYDHSIELRFENDVWSSFSDSGFVINVDGYWTIPVIIDWSNNKTNNNSLNLSVNTNESISFNSTADVSIANWNWVVNGEVQDNNYNNFTKTFTEGNHTLNVSGSNIAGTSNTVTWNIISIPQPASFDPSGYVKDQNGNPISGATVTLFNATTNKTAISNSTGYWNLSGQIADGVYSYRVTKTGYSDKTGTASIASGGNSLNITLSPAAIAPIDVKIAVILAKPSDKGPEPTHDKQYFENLLNRTRDYYLENSYGRININLSGSKIFDNNSNWYRLAKNSIYYGKNYSKIVSMNGINVTVWVDRTGEFKDDAVIAVPEPLYTYDAIAVVHPGDAEQYGNPDEMRTNAFIYGAGQNHFIVSEKDLMGAWAHELGHLVGVFEKPKEYTPDRYINGSLRTWDLMASGNYLTDREGDDRNGTSYPSHMSSWTKEYLGWLNYSIVSDKQTYWIPALEQMKYGDDVTVFDVPLKNGGDKYSYILEVRSENIGTWDRYLYGNKTILSDMLVVYKVDTTSIGSRSDIVNIFEDGSKNDMVFLNTTENYIDSRAEITIELAEEMGNKLKGYGANVRIIDSPVSNQNGADISTDTEASFFWKFIKWIRGWLPAPPKDYESFTLPDYDLHAFTQDSRHVGVNYITGNYENQIEGATASGDMLGGFEWIFVPDNEKVVFKVSNHDTGEFLKKYPEAANITFDMKYNLNIYHEDNNSVRYSAGVINQQIAPSRERDYFFNVVEKPDGTYEIVINEPLLQAFVDFEPRTLNINSDGKWIQAKIKIPGYNASQIDVSSIRLNGTIPAEKFEKDGEKDSENSQLKVKFNRTLVQSIVALGNVTLYISGEVNGEAFMGNDTIKVIGKKE